jgi:transcriptional regulator with PAS, ATPase and Fis domain
MISTTSPVNAPAKVHRNPPAPCTHPAIEFKTQSSELQNAIRTAFLLFQGFDLAPGLPILLSGETGVGKTFLAAYLHRLLGCDGSFIEVNCPTIQGELFLSELFGSKQGSYTGSVKDHEGLISKANNGVVFLDEISEVPLEQQAKLLQVIDSGTIKPVGSADTRKVRVKWIFATNKDLKEMVRSGSFREDLYFRINGHEVPIPPLRERLTDLDLLIESILKKLGSSNLFLDNEAKTRLTKHTWPGNVRELEAVLHRAVILAQGNTISSDHILINEDMPAGNSNEPSHLVGLSMKEIQRWAARATLDKHNGNKTLAAATLGITRATLRKYTG